MTRTSTSAWRSTSAMAGRSARCGASIVAATRRSGGRARWIRRRSAGRARHDLPDLVDDEADHGGRRSTLVGDGSVELDDAVDRWLPELADRRVMRDPDGSIDDTVRAERAITVRDLLTFTLGLGMDFARFGQQPVLQAATDLGLGDGPPRPQGPPPPDEWMRRLGTLPLEAQPGAAVAVPRGRRCPRRARRTRRLAARSRRR